MTAKSRGGQDPQETLREYVDVLFKDFAWSVPLVDEIAADESARQVIWSMYFTIPACMQCSTDTPLPQGFFVACGPMFELDYEHSIVQVCVPHTLS